VTTALFMVGALLLGIQLGQLRERRRHRQQLDLDLAFSRATQRPQ